MIEPEVRVVGTSNFYWLTGSPKTPQDMHLACEGGPTSGTESLTWRKSLRQLPWPLQFSLLQNEGVGPLIPSQVSCQICHGLSINLLFNKCS